MCVPAGRLNWQLHFGDPPKWSKDVRFILVDVEPSTRDADKAALVLKGDAAAVARQLSSTLRGLDTGRSAQWRQQLAQKAGHPCLRHLLVLSLVPLPHTSMQTTRKLAAARCRSASAAVHCPRLGLSSRQCISSCWGCSEHPWYKSCLLLHDLLLYRTSLLQK